VLQLNDNFHCSCNFWPSRGAGGTALAAMFWTFNLNNVADGWLGSRMVSVLDSGAVEPIGSNRTATLSKTVHTRRTAVLQAAKLVKGCAGNCGPGGK